jgi:hypothetical protein
MNELDVKHYLGVYQDRMKMQEEGITHPTDEIKRLTREIVKKLSVLPSDEPIVIKDGSLINSRGIVVASFPRKTKD